MSISTTIVPLNLQQDLGEQKFLGRGCFGIHNYMQGQCVNDINGEVITEEGRYRRFNRDINLQLEMLNYWTHSFHGHVASDIEKNLVETADIMNSMSCYRDVFTITSANSVAVNLREHPADQIFTGLMLFRSILEGQYRGMDFLAEGIEDREEWLKRKRIGIALVLAGLGRDFFGGWSQRGRANGSSESTSIVINNYMSAAAFLPLVVDSDEYTKQVWVQNPFGVGDNENGYVRNHNQDALRRFARAKDQDPDEYETMSEWLKLWSNCYGHKREAIDDKLGNITVQNFTARLIQRTGPSSGLTTEEVGNTISSLFSELVEYYND